eukprot:UN00327
MPHAVETKEDSTSFRGRRHRKPADKICHICGEFGHFKKHCPQKQDKKRPNGRCNGNRKKHGPKNGKGKLIKMIFKTNELKKKKEGEIAILNEQTRKLQQLLDDSENLDAKTLQNEIKNIAKSFKKCNQQKRKQEKKLAKEKKEKVTDNEAEDTASTDSEPVGGDHTDNDNEYEFTFIFGRDGY